MIFQKLNAPHLNAQIAEDGIGSDVHNEIWLAFFKGLIGFVDCKVLINFYLDGRQVD